MNTGQPNFPGKTIEICFEKESHVYLFHFPLSVKRNLKINPALPDK